MKIAIMQPYFFPYIGYFQLINAADEFVIYDNIEFSSQKAEQELGFHPEYSLKEGISRTVKWYKDQNLL